MTSLFASIHEVIKTLLEAFRIGCLSWYMCSLQDLRSHVDSGYRYPGCLDR